MAADRIPPWFPRSPPSRPESTPAGHARTGPNLIPSEYPKTPSNPAENKRTASSHFKAGVLAAPWSKAPSKAPAALVTPNVQNTFRSRCLHHLRNRTRVARKWGIATMLTANFISVSDATTGVRMLPTPKPATAATAAPRIAAKKIGIGNVVLSILRTILEFVRGMPFVAARANEAEPAAIRVYSMQSGAVLNLDVSVSATYDQGRSGRRVLRRVLSTLVRVH